MQLQVKVSFLMVELVVSQISKVRYLFVYCACGFLIRLSGAVL